MRVTLVTETFSPQVNGVSRTLGYLVRHLEEAGDEVQVVHPDYGHGPGAGGVHLVRSIALPFYKDLRLPLPPFGGVHRAIEAFRPDLVHIATEATLGLSALRFALRGGIPVVSSFHTNFDQYSAHYGVGWARSLIWRYLRWFHNRTRETYVPSRTTIAELESRGFERLALWPRGVDSLLFRPDRPGRVAVRRGLGFGPDDVVIGHVGRIAAEKNIGYLVEALEHVARSVRRSRFVFVGDGPARDEMGRRMGPHAAVRRLSTGRGPRRPLRGVRPVRVRQHDRDVRQRGPGGDGERASPWSRSARGGWPTRSAPASRESWSSRMPPRSGSPRP